MLISGKINEYPKYFIKNNHTISESKEIANAFNKFSVSVGPALANEIVQPSDINQLDVRNIKNNPNSFFIRGVNDNEIIEIVSSFKNMRSTDGLI